MTVFRTIKRGAWRDPRRVRTALKRAVLPVGCKARTLPLGIGRGIRMHIDFAYETRLYLGIYELELNRHLKRICRPGATTFDVGGQYGYDALVFAKLTGAAVLSFECDPCNLERMARTIALNPGLNSLVEPVQATVGSGRTGTVSLDKHSARTFAPDFIKIDAEGAELEVLRGASNLLRSRRPALVVEVHSAELERRCGRLLVEHGYRPLIVSQRRVLADYRPTDQLNRWLVAV